MMRDKKFLPPAEETIQSELTFLKVAMHCISISDQIYTVAKRAAEANGLTVPDYLEALVIHDAEVLKQEAAILSAEQIARVREGQEDVRAGRVFTPLQVREHLHGKHEAWLKRHPR